MLENIKKQLESAYEIRDINDIEKDIDEGKNLLKNSSIEEKKQYINKIEIKYDKKWTTEAIFNIVENAVKYGFSEIYEGGYIRIRITEENDVLVLSVYNTGMPMNKDMVEKINGLTHLPISQIKEAFPDKKHGYGCQCHRRTEYRFSFYKPQNLLFHKFPSYKSFAIKVILNKEYQKIKNCLWFVLTNELSHVYNDVSFKLKRQ